MDFLKSWFFVFVVIFQYAIAKEPPSSSEILRYTENHLPLSGTLKTSQHFIYVDLEDDYIHQLIFFIEGEGFKKPPYFGSPDLVGAHITVVYPDEMQQYEIQEAQVPTQQISFNLKECQVVHPLRLKEIDEVYLIAIESPELDKIREDLGLPKKKYDFHITIGMKPKKKSHH
ncbi:MAG: hypothetical protein H7A41_03530 [Chlamydiales bacterium]|nr:hypothetical protein [Chlamydiia bacterium]MCP5504207.1 hypothetical protein [Chlamydiales bacterium]